MNCERGEKKKGLREIVMLEEVEGPMLYSDSSVSGLHARHEEEEGDGGGTATWSREWDVIEN